MKKRIIVIAISLLSLVACQRNIKTVNICEATIDKVKYQASIYATDDEVTKLISRVITELANDQQVQQAMLAAKNIEAQLTEAKNVVFNYEVTDTLFTQNYTFSVAYMDKAELQKYLVASGLEFDYISKQKMLDDLAEAGYQCQLRN